MHWLLDQACDFPARLGTDRLDGLAAFSQRDLSLALALDEDRLLDAYRTVAQLLPRVGLDGGTVRQLLVKPQVDLLPRYFRRQRPHRRIGYLVLRIVPGSARHMSGEPAFDIGDAIAALRRHHEGRGECDTFVRLLGETEEARLRHEVDLVDDENFGCGDICELCPDGQGFVIEPTLGVDNQRDDVGVVGAAPCDGDHGPVEPAARRKDAGRVDENQLGGAFDRDAADHRPRGLHLGVTMVTLLPTIALTRVDFPTLGAPMMATKPQCSASLPSPACGGGLGRGCGASLEVPSISTGCFHLDALLDARLAASFDALLNALSGQHGS